ncbi:hypothetical protein DXT97_12635 [Agrobacterium tumefaciens]|uniref:hypothetical protein n=1 Tax=Agrobacterium tumefaciens TaxID=358 RepID=UPI0012968435|nr:hypothetical protein [Agrobacterium tumefaciens]MQB37639.1 hypothetical protein [Agrobacterium tumefaciens]
MTGSRERKLEETLAMEALYNLYNRVKDSFPSLAEYPVMRDAKKALGSFVPEEASKIEALTAERDRLREELEKANNEFGCETSEWPDLWRRIASLKEALRVTGWRLINTAPTDGRDLILTSSEWNGDVVIGSFAFGRWRETPSPEGHVINPTHWMPRRNLPQEGIGK